MREQVMFERSNTMNAIELNDALKKICDALNKMNDELDPAIISTEEIVEAKHNMYDIKEELKKMFDVLEDTRVNRLPQLYNKQYELNKQLCDPCYALNRLLGEQISATDKDVKIFASALANYKQAIDAIVGNHREELRNPELDWYRGYLFEENEDED